MDTTTTSVKANVAIRVTGLPLVSVVLPVYNGQKHLAKTFDHLLAQTFTDFELIFCDNASTDSSYSIAERYAALDPRVRLYRNQQNIGSVGNYRRAYSLCRGKYFRFATANDLAHPELLEKCVAVLESDPTVSLAHGRTQLIDEEGCQLEIFDDRLRLLDAEPDKRFITMFHNLRMANPLGGLIRMESLRKTRFLGKFIASDIVLMGELVLVGKYVEIPEVLFYRRMGDTTSDKSLEELKKFYDPLSHKRIAMIFWRLQWEHMRSVMRSDLSTAQKLRLLLFLTKNLYWDRKRLLGELTSGVRQAFRTSVSDINAKTAV